MEQRMEPCRNCNKDGLVPYKETDTIVMQRCTQCNVVHVVLKK